MEKTQVWTFSSKYLPKEMNKKGKPWWKASKLVEELSFRLTGTMSQRRITREEIDHPRLKDSNGKKNNFDLDKISFEYAVPHMMLQVWWKLMKNKACSYSWYIYHQVIETFLIFGGFLKYSYFFGTFISFWKIADGLYGLNSPKISCSGSSNYPFGLFWVFLAPATQHQFIISPFYKYIYIITSISRSFINHFLNNYLLIFSF